jgi:xanthine dehydrogenase YagS FAD-binding subunit
MNSFELLRPKSIYDALKAVAAENPPTIKAGGVDLLDRMKEGIDAPAALLDVLPLPELRGIQLVDGFLRIGAAATLAQIATDPLVHEHAPAIAEAASEAATPQIRNVATAGGNLLQRTRCWYYRTGDFEPCYKRGGGFCPAKEGRNKYNAIFDTDSASCVCVNPSSLATALFALDARFHGVSNRTKRAERNDPIASLLSVGPDTDHALEASELLVAVNVPVAARRSAYREFNERASFDWALVSCAVSFVWKDGVASDPRIVLGAVAHKPIRRAEAEKLLDGQKLTPELARAVAAKAVEGAKPLAENGYKVPIAKALVARALLAAAGLEEKK